VKVVPTAIPEVLLLEPRVFGDERGFFLEPYNKRVFRDATGLDPQFVQDNHSRSKRGVLRGLHYQILQPQGKLIRVLSGRIFDVAVDLRRSSASFGKWTGAELDGESMRMMWIPAGFAHGFTVLSDTADVLYKTTDYYAPQHERTLRWDDPQVGVAWPLFGEPTLSDKDRRGTALAGAETYA
jgi:dTDP-4-dehydrorhamnose 3,5-epimerase